MDLDSLANTLERFSDIGIVGCALLFTIAIVTGQVFTKKQVEEIKATLVAQVVESAADLAVCRAELARIQRAARRKKTT